MKVVLLQNINSLGKRGDIKDVNDGYAMNFLLPQAKALVATVTNVGNIQREQVSPQVQADMYQKFFKVLDRQLLNFVCKVSDKDGLFKSVTNQDIISAIEEKFNIGINDKCIKTPVHIKKVGEYKVNINLPNKQVISLLVSVKKEES